MYDSNAVARNRLMPGTAGVCRGPLSGPGRVLPLLAAALLALSLPLPATASPMAYSAITHVSAGLIGAPATARRPLPAQDQQEEARRPPPVADPAAGWVVSVLGGSVFSGASAFQTGGAVARFFGPKATFGFEAEGTITFGPGGRVAQGMGSLIVQFGARTSKFVPYFAVGGGYVRANAKVRDQTRVVLEQFGIDPQPTTESAPLLQYGGGVRFYMKPHLSFRGDARFALVSLDVPSDGFFDALFAMRRIAGMVSWDF